jgi:hypothetical protein
MRKLLLAICFTSVCATMPATARVSVASTLGRQYASTSGRIRSWFRFPAIRHYAPQLSANYFFYDSMFWVYVGTLVHKRVTTDHGG